MHFGALQQRSGWLSPAQSCLPWLGFLVSRIGLHLKGKLWPVHTFLQSLYHSVCLMRIFSPKHILLTPENCPRRHEQPSWYSVLPPERWKKDLIFQRKNIHLLTTLWDKYYCFYFPHNETGQEGFNQLSRSYNWKELAEFRMTHIFFL